ncbi:MAG TPA: sigma-70 family RNA polymerase sigma factor [Steroidobacteraceae bacterium]|nr:sigma-70 family RNA polymerase sigma factor [Steroidobacteraceae bacterium]
MSEDIDLEELARQAIAGDRHAVEKLVRSLQGDVYSLALRMLWNREDAQDATQELLVRVVTRLASFDFLSRLRTWVYRVAVNYLLDVKKSAVERMNLSFERLVEDVQDGLSDTGPPAHEASVLVEEVKIGCTLAMLQCLDRPHRLAYILGEIFDLRGPEAAAALGVDAAVLRKRLERARSAVLAFAQSYCGLASDTAACSCNGRVRAALRLGRVNPDAVTFAEHAVSFDQLRATVRRVEQGRLALELHRSSRPRAPSRDLVQQIVSAIDAEDPH